MNLDEKNNLLLESNIVFCTHQRELELDYMKTNVRETKVSTNGMELLFLQLYVLTMNDTTTVDLLNFHTMPLHDVCDSTRSRKFRLS